jgi:hypothetical protein
VAHRHDREVLKGDPERTGVQRGERPNHVHDPNVLPISPDEDVGDDHPGAPERTRQREPCKHCEPGIDIWLIGTGYRPALPLDEQQASAGCYANRAIVRGLLTGAGSGRSLSGTARVACQCPASRLGTHPSGCQMRARGDRGTLIACAAPPHVPAHCSRSGPSLTGRARAGSAGARCVRTSVPLRMLGGQGEAAQRAPAFASYSATPAREDPAARI